jgi:hypothetical protein
VYDLAFWPNFGWRALVSLSPPHGDREVALQFWVGVTDKNWFEYLRSEKPDEVNL